MKKIIPIVILILYSFNLYSQISIKGGLNYSTITDHSLSKYKFSGHIGGTYDFKLSKKWYFQPELLFTSIGCNLKDDGSVVKDGHINIYALEMPVNLSFRPEISDNLHLLVDFGIYLRYGLFGNKKYNYYDSPKVDESPFNAYNRFDAGLNIGLGLQKNNYYGIFTFQRGLTHAEKGMDGAHQVLHFSLGYRF
jgi:hypothetical protein